MSFGPAFDAKEQVRQAVDIVDLVGSYVQLRRQGRNYVGLCPWHDDSRPSLQVNPERQSFKCWVCDYGGDVFSFVMRAENLEFREALELLAERAGIELQQPPRTHGEPGGHAARPDHRPKSARSTASRPGPKTNSTAASSNPPKPNPAASISPSAASRTKRSTAFNSASPRTAGTGSSSEPAAREWTPPMLERVGLLRRKELGGGFYDWFRGRVMFSIRDSRSRPIAFGGRVLPQLADERSAKYINSPETPLFSKSRELYGLDVARENFKADGGAIVMEGYTDVLMAHQHGIDNCVAVLGTALGERHLQLLRRYTDSITLVLDGDAAGRRRTNEIFDALLALFEKNQIDLRILTLPEGVDPCDFIATHGSDPFRALLATAVDALEHKFKVVTNGLDTLTDTHRASQAAEQLLATLAQIRPAGGGSFVDDALARRADAQPHRPPVSFAGRKAAQPLELAASRSDAPRRRSQRDATTTANDASTSQPLRLADLPAWDRDLLELIILDPTFVPRVGRRRSIRSDFTSPAARRIYLACCRIADRGRTKAISAACWPSSTSPTMKSLLVQLDESCATKGNGRPRTLARRPARNAPPPRRRNRSPHRPGRRPPERRQRRTTVGRVLRTIQTKTPQRIRKEKEVACISRKSLVVHC